VTICPYLTRRMNFLNLNVFYIFHPKNYLKNEYTVYHDPKAWDKGAGTNSMYCCHLKDHSNNTKGSTNCCWNFFKVEKVTFYSGKVMNSFCRKFDKVG